MKDNLLRIGNRILDTATGIVYEKIAGTSDVVHVYRLESCSRGIAATYLKCKDEEARALWQHMSSQAVTLI